MAKIVSIAVRERSGMFLASITVWGALAGQAESKDRANAIKMAVRDVRSTRDRD